MASLNGFYAAASLVHPSFVDVKDAEQAAAPILAIPSKDEPDMVSKLPRARVNLVAGKH